MSGWQEERESKPEDMITHTHAENAGFYKTSFTDLLVNSVTPHS